MFSCFSAMSSTLVTALRLGTSQITGKCILRNPVTGKDEVISEDTVLLHVVSLKTIQIRVPLVHIRIGAVMPATIWGIPDLSPMVLGTLQGMQISWSVNQREVVEIFNVFSESGKYILAMEAGTLISIPCTDTALERRGLSLCSQRARILTFKMFSDELA